MDYVGLDFLVVEQEQEQEQVSMVWPTRKIEGSRVCTILAWSGRVWYESFGSGGGEGLVEWAGKRNGKVKRYR